MKIRSLILGALAVLGLMTSCSMEEDVTPSVPNIVLSDEYLYFEHEGGEFTLALASTADWYAETYEDWITVSPSSGWGSSEAQPVTISVLPNEEAYERYGDVWFYVEGHSVYVTVCQEGNYSYDEGIVDVTVAEFIEKEVSTDHWYRITGTVGGPINAIYGNFDIIDETGTVYVYGISNWSDYSEIFAVGGTVTVVGQRGDYNGKVEVLEGYIEYYEPGEDTGDDEPSDGRPSELIAATVADFLAAEVSTEVWYELTGEITSIVEGNAYGNLYINDGTGEVYIYGLTNGWVGYNDKSFDSIGLKVGDTVTLGTLRSEYRGTPQGGGSSFPAYYISHESSYAPVPGEDGPFANGKYYIVAGEKAATALSADKSYGYIPSVDAASVTEADAFTFQFYPEFGGYTIQDSYGRYLYNALKSDGETPYTSFNVATELPNNEEECGFYMWCVDSYDDTSLDIYNVATLLSICWSPNWGTWELADPYVDTFTNVLPTLVPVTETK